MMLIGRHWDDATVLRASRAFEETGAYSAGRVAEEAGGRRAS
jgi:Asp-tRNA(Asn)/Glu-tRNA(Gln) amidotransferase A subunit family amidase